MVNWLQTRNFPNYCIASNNIIDHIVHGEDIQIEADVIWAVKSQVNVFFILNGGSRFQRQIHDQYFLLLIRDATTSVVNLKIDNNTLALEKVVTFLGVLFDKQLTWTTRINYVVDKCKTRLNLMR